MSENIVTALEKNKIIVIVRGIDKEHIIPLAEAMYKGGIRFIEVTFDAKGICTDEQTAEKIKILNNAFDGRMYIGAGTVINEKQAEIACAAGAKYIISPDTNPAVIKRTKQLGMLSMPGALTPTEALTAHNSGADYVKLFPVGELGVSYFKAVKAPLSHIRFLAVGGITLDNMRDYLDAGAYGFGIGSSIVKKSLIEQEKFDEISHISSEYVAKIK